MISSAILDLLNKYDYDLCFKELTKLESFGCYYPYDIYKLVDDAGFEYFVAKEKGKFTKILERKEHVYYTYHEIKVDA